MDQMDDSTDLVFWLSIIRNKIGSTSRDFKAAGRISAAFEE